MKSWKFWFGLGLVLHLGTAAWNPGIIAADDYNNAVALMIPAQRPVPIGAAMAHGVHPPLPKWIVHSVAEVPRWMGIEAPRTQLAWALVILTLFVYVGTALALIALVPKDRSRERAVVAFLAAAYGLCPLLFSRPMNEVMATPFLIGSAWLCTRYWERGSRSDLALSIGLLAMASTMRFQAGVCIAAIALAVFARRKEIAGNFLGDAAVFFGAGAMAAVLTGLLDVALLGHFHEGIRRYVNYNLHAGELHGTAPFYRYLGLFIAATLPPTLIGRYRNFDVRAAFAPYLPALAYFTIFFVAHSLTPHKEERFMIPVLPLFLLLLGPLIHYWLDRPSGRWRLGFGFTVNLLLLVCTSVMTPQKSLVDLMTWLDRSPAILRVFVYGESMPVAPVAFVRRELTLVPMTATSDQVLTCDDAIVVRDDLLAAAPFAKDTRLEVAEHFDPTPLDALLVRANPRHNARRGGMTLLVPRGCNSVAIL